MSQSGQCQNHRDKVDDFEFLSVSKSVEGTLKELSSLKQQNFTQLFVNDFAVQDVLHQHLFTKTKRDFKNHLNIAFFP